MRKKLKGVIQQTVWQSLVEYLRSSLTWLLVIFLCVYVYQNARVSQTINPLYFQVVNENREGYIDFLKKIRYAPHYDRFLSIATHLWGTDIENEVNEEHIRITNDIIHLQQLLAQNPQSRDILIALAKLYKEQSNIERSQYYLRLAQQVDPAISLE